MENEIWQRNVATQVRMHLQMADSNLKAAKAHFATVAQDKKATNKQRKKVMDAYSDASYAYDTYRRQYMSHFRTSVVPEF